MKTYLRNSVLALFAFAAALQVSARDPKNQQVANSFGEISLDQVDALVPVNGDLVTRGTSRVVTSLRLGSPSRVLADGSWIYYNYVVRIGRNDAGHAGALVVRFSSGQVSNLTLADDATLVALCATPRKTTRDQVLTAGRKQ